MSKLNEEPVESMLKDADPIEAVVQTEEVWGTVQCFHCEYFGKMTGYIEAANKKIIRFVCPECNSVEDVKNPEYSQ